MFNKITYLLLISALIGCASVPQLGSRKIAADGLKTEIEDVLQIAKENGLYAADEKSYMVISWYNDPRSLSAHLVSLPEMKPAIIQQGALDKSPVAKISWNKLVDSFISKIETEEQADAFKAVMMNKKLARYILPEKADYRGQGYNGGWYYEDFRSTSTDVMSHAVMLFESASAVQNKEQLDSFLKINELVKEFPTPNALSNYITLLNDLRKNPEYHKNAVMILEYVADSNNKILGPMQNNRVALQVNKYASPYANLAYNVAKIRMSQIDPDSYEAEIEKIDFSIVKNKADFESFNNLKYSNKTTYALNAVMTSELNEKAVQQLSVSERALLMAKAEGFYLNDKNAWVNVLWYKNPIYDYFISLDGVKDSVIDVVQTYRDERVGRLSWNKLMQNLVDKIQTEEQLEAFKTVLQTSPKSSNPMHYVHRKVNVSGHAFDYMNHSSMDIMDAYIRLNTAVSVQNKQQLESFQKLDKLLVEIINDASVYKHLLVSKFQNIMQLFNETPERHADILMIVEQLKKTAYQGFISSRDIPIELKYKNAYSDLAYNFARYRLSIEPKDAENLNKLSAMDFSVVKTMEDFKHVSELPLKNKTVFASLSTIEGELKRLQETAGARQEKAAALEMAQKLAQEQAAALEVAKKASPANETCTGLVKKIMGFFGK